MTLQLGGGGAITGCTSLQEPDLIVSGLTVNGDIDAPKIIVSPGTAAAPSYTFSGDTDNGLYYAGTNSIGLATAGTNAILIDSSGNVGIGTSSPGNYLANAHQLVIADSAASTGITIATPASSAGTIVFADGTGGNANKRGVVEYNHLSNSMKFMTNAADAVLIDSSGRLLVGTSSDITNDANYLTQNVSTGGGSIALGRNDGTTGINASIGRLTFYGNDGGTYEPVGQIECEADASHASGDKPGRLMFSTTADGASTPTERLRIDSSGNVGIGTTSPNSLLHLNNDATSGTDVTYFKCEGNGSSLEIKCDDLSNTNSGWSFRTGSNESMRFVQGSNERMRIDSSGRLLVGTSSALDTSAEAIVHVADTRGARLVLARNDTSVAESNVLGGIRFAGKDTTGNNYTTLGEIICQADGTHAAGDNPTRLVFSTTADGASTPTERMRIRNTGVISTFNSVGDSLNLYNASSAGTSNAFLYGLHSATNNVSGGTTSIIIYTNGNVINTNNSYGAISDIKLKENIVDASSQWDDLKALQVRNYNFKEGQTHTQIGLVAQELELVSPGLVSESPDTDEEGNDLGTVTKSVNYSVLYMKAVKALQEAIGRIETLETEVALLRSN